MRPRPQPNRRRGLLRAALTVIALTAILIIAIGIAGVVHQPAKPAAPTPPPTVNLTPPPSPTPGGTVKPTTKPKARPAPTATKTPKGAALAPSPGTFFERAFSGARWPVSAVASPDGKRLAYFLGKRGAYAASRLAVVDRRNGAIRIVGAGDRLSRPVWSRDGRYLLYVRVAPTRRSPGAMWRLVRADTVTGRSLVLWKQPALNLQPLGWRAKSVLYAAAEETDTAVYAVRNRIRTILGMMMSEPITNATLSPDGRFVAFGTPTNCTFCTVGVYDLNLQWAWTGPSGMPNETDIAWGTHDLLVVSLGKKLAVIRPGGFHPPVTYKPLPTGLPRVWRDPMRVALHGDKLVITDTVTHRPYVTS